jgi:hypothetical protein
VVAVASSRYLENAQLVARPTPAVDKIRPSAFRTSLKLQGNNEAHKQLRVFFRNSFPESWGCQEAQSCPE